MRKLTILVVIVVTLWGGYWFIGSTAMESGLKAWFDLRRAEGWQADYTTLNTTGFPNRFDTNIEGLELADPASGLAWSAPLFQIFALTYKPGHINAVWPDHQVLATPNERITITSDNMRGSLVFNETTDLNLNRTSIMLEGMGFSSTDNWSSSLERGQLAMRQVEGVENTYEVHFEAKGITPASQFLKNLEDIEHLTGVIQGMSIDAIIEFDAPWDRFAIERARPQITRIDLKLMQADWGQLDLRMAGELAVDSQGTPTGQITIKAKNWREMVALAQQTGFLPGAIVPTLEDTLGFLASLSGDKSTIDTPLTFRGGYIAFGPVPIGPAPDLTIR